MTHLPTPRPAETAERVDVPDGGDAAGAEVKRLLSTALSEAHTAGQFGQTLDNGFVSFWEDKVLAAFALLTARNSDLTAQLAAERHRAEVAAMEKAARIIAPVGPRPCDCEHCDCGNPGDHAHVVAWDEATASAAAIRAQIATLKAQRDDARRAGEGAVPTLNWHAPTDKDKLKLAVFGSGGLITWTEEAWHSLMLSGGETRIRPLQWTPTEVADVPGMAEARSRAHHPAPSMSAAEREGGAE